MSNEEQTQEIEILQSIYPDEFTQTSDVSFRIRLQLDPPPILGNEDEPPIINLHVTYPPEYPDAAPDLDITIDHSSPQSSLSFPEDKDSLLASLASAIEENMGMAMVFALTSTLKEAAEELVHGRAAAIEEARENALRHEEEKEMEKFRGTLVTKERFVEWQKKFLEEQEAEQRRLDEEREAEDKGKRMVAVKEKKLTGKELFEKGLVGEADWDDEGEDADISKLKIEA